MDIRHVYIRPRAPHLNSKVERSHQVDDQEFYQLLDKDGVTDDIVKRLDALADRSMSQARYIVKRDDPIPLIVRPWPYVEVDLEKLMDPRQTFARDAPQAWAQQVPKEFLPSLPGDGLRRTARAAIRTARCISRTPGGSIAWRGQFHARPAVSVSSGY